MKRAEKKLILSKELQKNQSPISVFLVDDDGTFLATLEYYLRKKVKAKMRIESFTNGEDCLNEIECNPTIDLVILDYYLYNESQNAMNGLEVLKKIKEINSEIVVVMLSSEDKREIALACTTYGAYEYVVKSETALIRTQNIIKNLIHAITLRPFYTSDIGGES